MKFLKSFVVGHRSAGLQPALRARIKAGCKPALLCFALLILTGCQTPPEGNIVSFTQSFVGIDVSQNPANQTPQLRVGFARTQYHRIPTSTNTVYSAPISSGIDVSHEPLTTSITENFSTIKEVAVPENPIAKAIRKKLETKK